MKISEHSLRSWINIDWDLKKICEKITFSGLEVEEIEEFYCSFPGIIVGEIISISSHLSFKKMNIIQVDIGKNFLINILCDIKYSIFKKMKVLVATIDSGLLNMNTIKNLYIKYGIFLGGILCSYDDLKWFGGDNIVELPVCAPIGINLKNYYSYFDKFIKINVTPNRIDACSIFGIVRDICILKNLDLPKIFHGFIPSKSSKKCKIHVQINNVIHKCLGRLINNIDLKTPTPIWMKEKLRKYKILSVNIVIDIMNYASIHFGQSLYIFSFLKDFNDISLKFYNGNINFKNYQKNIILNDRILILQHKSDLLAILGHIDFNYFNIDTQHTNLFIGSFFFDQNSLNQSIYQFKKNNKSQCNEYFVDPSNQKQVIEYVTNLFLKICGGISGSVTSIQSEEYYNYQNRKIKFHVNMVKNITGCMIDYEIIKSILIRLGYHLSTHPHILYVVPPKWRIDIAISEDVVSDIMRIYNYSFIPELPLNNNIVISKYDSSEFFLKRVKYSLIDRGYNEVVTYSFVNSDKQRVFYPKEKFLYLLNPISQDMSCMRHSLWIGLIETLLYHQNRQFEELRFFESGLCFYKNSEKELGVDQIFHVSGIIGNTKYKYHWDVSARNFDFYDIKGDVECIFETLGYLENINFIPYKYSGLHPNKSVKILFNNKLIGGMGELDPYILKKFNLKYSVFLFEVFWDYLIFKDNTRIKRISEFPLSQRDASIIISNEILVNDIVILCKNHFKDKLLDIKISDIYQGPSIPYGKKSITLTFVFQSAVTTLCDRDIEEMMCWYMKYLNIHFQAILRN